MKKETTLENLSAIGYAIFDNVYSQEEVHLIIETISKKYHEKNLPQKNENLFAIRQLLIELPELKKLLFNENLKAFLPKEYFLTKSIFFDKPGNSNWFVSFHQDLSITVKEKTYVEGYQKWTHKKGQYGVIPPKEILENTITIRIHLDDTDSQNGALYVIPKSHKNGVVRVETVNVERSHVCEIKQGGIMLMKPLTFHASKRSTEDRNRRVIHLEFNNRELKKPLEWKERINLH